MSHSFSTSTYTTDVTQVPARLESPDQLRAAATAAFLARDASPGKLVFVHGATRSGWAIYTVKALTATCKATRDKARTTSSRGYAVSCGWSKWRFQRVELSSMSSRS